MNERLAAIRKAIEDDPQLASANAAKMRGDAESTWFDLLVLEMEEFPLVEEDSLAHDLWRRPDAESLTQRELQTLEAVSHGLTRDMAAEVLGISVETVSHIS